MACSESLRVQRAGKMDSAEAPCRLLLPVARDPRPGTLIAITLQSSHPPRRGNSSRVVVECIDPVLVRRPACSLRRTYRVDLYRAMSRSSGAIGSSSRRPGHQFTRQPPDL